MAFRLLLQAAMLLDQLLQGGTGGAEQAPGGGSTAVPALVGDAATAEEGAGFSDALGLLTGGDASGDEAAPAGAALVPGEIISAETALLGLPPSEVPLPF